MSLPGILEWLSVCSAVVLGRRTITAARGRNPIWQVDHLVGMAGTERAGCRSGTQLILAKLSHDILFFFFIFEKQVNILTISSTSWPSGDIKAEKNYCWWQTKRPEYLSGVIIAVSEECLKPDPEFTAWTRAQRGIWFEKPSSNAVEYPCGQFTSPATAMLPPSFFCEPGKAWDGGEENVLGLG